MQDTFLLAYACLLLLLPQATAFYLYTPKAWGDFATQRRPAKGSRSIPASSISTPERAINLPLRRHRVARRPLRLRDSAYDITSAPRPTQTNSVGIDQDGTDYTYMASMQFGTSQTEYHMLLDTAASNTWVMSSDCKSDVCGFHNTLGKDSSSTLQTTDAQFSVAYGTGNVNCTVASDTVHFAGLSVDLKFGLATGISEDFASFPLDGILGLGRIDSDPHGTNAPSLMEALIHERLIDAKVIGVHLGRHATPPIDGELNLGAPNPTRYDGDLHYIDIIDNANGFWEIPIDDAGVNGQSSGLQGRSAILDTGTSFLLIPPGDASKIHNLIPGSKSIADAYTVPCDSTAAIQFTFGGKTYNVSSLDYVGRDNGNGACNSQIIPRRTFGENQWLLGDVFLKNVYTVFDWSESKVGFGVKGDADVETNGSPDPSPTATGASPTLPSTAPTSSDTDTLTSGNDQQNTASSASQGAAPSNKARSGSGMLALGVAMGGLIAAM
ncbi:acid protease [Pseudovirgaria hyperparasitica]|uniref:Acid protease n=1 Tax=Pseudovirgaria hyperparasitica TaxID=470096 RepID=A0A6A6WCD9_9PEZI|nr:acid protease [Pseudovirgaria hyperparasitica]KAF2759630.1 acid protease [Pseudovirgaria hyperparasitica]